MTDTVLYEVSDAIATVTLNRPDRLNAINPELLSDLLVALRQANADPAVHVIVLTGAGRAFCAGDDLKEFESQVGTCLLYTSPSPRDLSTSRMPSSA